MRSSTEQKGVGVPRFGEKMNVVVVVVANTSAADSASFDARFVATVVVVVVVVVVENACVGTDVAVVVVNDVDLCHTLSVVVVVLKNSVVASGSFDVFAVEVGVKAVGVHHYCTSATTMTCYDVTSLMTYHVATLMLMPLTRSDTQNCVMTSCLQLSGPQDVTVRSHVLGGNAVVGVGVAAAVAVVVVVVAVVVVASFRR